MLRRCWCHYGNNQLLLLWYGMVLKGHRERVLRAFGSLSDERVRGLFGKKRLGKIDAPRGQQRGSSDSSEGCIWYVCRE